MIQTQHITTTKRRGSLHKNLFDPEVVNIPSPKSYNYAGKREYRGSSARNGLLYTINPREQFLSSLIGEEQWEYLHESFTSGLAYIQQTLSSRSKLQIPLLCLVWYVVSSISSNLCRTILKGFPHPVALTEIQFLFTAILCTSFISLINYYERPRRHHSGLSHWVRMFPEGTFPEYLDGDFHNSIVNKFLKPSALAMQCCLPLGIFQFVGHISTHKATSMIPVSLVHSMKALSPIVTVGYYRLVEQKQYTRATYTSLCAIVAGVICTCFSGKSKSNREPHYYQGLLFALLSMAIFVAQNIFAKGVLTHKSTKSTKSARGARGANSKPDKGQLDKITILLYCSCIGFVLTLPVLLSSMLFSSAVTTTYHPFFKLVALLLLHNVAHFLQAMLAFQLIGLLSPVNYSVANIAKRIVVICVALLWESKHSPAGLLGVAVTMAGLYGYDRARSETPGLRHPPQNKYTAT